MIELLIGDCHFGTHTNKTLWLNTQIEFFEKQVYPLIDKVDRIVFLGDLFDIRYSTNTQVGIEVKTIIRRMIAYNKPVIIVAGNHDYYSPLKNLDYYNVYDLVFGSEFERCYNNLFIVKDKPLYIDDSLFLPWYYTEEEDLWKSVCDTYKGYVKTIYCHSDLSQWGNERLESIGYPQVYSGHIHYPWSNKELKLNNIGAIMSFNFSDANSDRYIYIVENSIFVEKIKNITTPKFKRYLNEQIFNITTEDTKNNYIELYISNDNINKARYIERIAFIKCNYEYFDINIRCIANIDEYEQLTPVKFDTNIDTYIEENIPDHLKDKFELVKQKIKNDTTCI
ncbi:MAG: metallophosphoesterase [Clostridia bacterium]|nr:metallophosphoesterase [Clostridia bacterium]